MRRPRVDAEPSTPASSITATRARVAYLAAMSAAIQLAHQRSSISLVEAEEMLRYGVVTADGVRSVIEGAEPEWVGMLDPSASRREVLHVHGDSYHWHGDYDESHRHIATAGGALALPARLLDETEMGEDPLLLGGWSLSNLGEPDSCYDGHLDGAKQGRDGTIICRSCGRPLDLRHCLHDELRSYCYRCTRADIRAPRRLEGR